MYVGERLEITAQVGLGRRPNAGKDRPIGWCKVLSTLRISIAASGKSAYSWFGETGSPISKSFGLEGWVAEDVLSSLSAPAFIMVASSIR